MNIDFIMTWLRDLLAATPVRLVVQIIASLLSAMILVQGVKAVIKEFWKARSARSRRIRRWLFFITAYIAGFQASEYFIDSPGTMSAFIGIVNPIVYVLWVRWAEATGHNVQLAVLKGRRLEQ